MRIPIYYHHHHLIRVLLLETTVITGGRRGIRSSFATTAFSFPFPTSNIRQHFLHHHRRADGGVVAMYHDDERSSIIDINTNTNVMHKTVVNTVDDDGNDNDNANDNKKEKENNVTSIRKEKESLAFTKVLNPNDMIEYYNKTKKILQRDDDDDDDDDNDEEFINTMNNKFLELRHKKSMIRCVLNNYDPNSYSTNDGNDSNIDRKTKKEALLITKVDFQQRLRLIERRNKWNITHRLLFGCDDNNDQNENDNNDQNGNENNASTSYWWTLKDGVIDNEKAPEFLIGIEEHYNYDNDNDNDNDDDDDDDGNITTAASTSSTMKTKTKRRRNKKQQSSYEYENSEDPKRFLSRLARGRTYKGNFRNLLQDIDDANDSSKENLLSLYDEITGVVDATDGGKEACCGCDKEVQLLHSFVDELEREQQEEEELTMTTTTTTTSSVSESASDADAAVRRLIVNKEQIDLLRMICNLDDHNNNNNNNNNGSSPSSNTVDDGGRSWGKRGESNLNLYLEERHKQESTISSTTMVLSPVWVRGKKKNRQRNNCNNNDKSRNKKDSSNNKKNNFNNNIKQRCQYVLETTNTDVLLSSGTTSEFDAMVVRTTTYDNDNYDVQKEQEQEQEQEQEEQKPLVALPMMIIEEVWDAKATLDPSALLDVLNKKVTSLQRILFHNYNNNDDGNDDDDGNSETNEEEERSAIIEAADAKFVIFPDNNNNKKHPNTKTAATNMPIVFQVGIGSKDIDGDDDSNNNNDNNGFDDDDDEIKIGSCCQQQNLLLLPQIGIFTNRMFSPKSAARRIETIVYERLLETDVDTVKSIIMTRNNNNNNKYDVEGNDNDYNRRHHRHRRIIRDESVKIIDRIIRLIETIQPIVVIGDCNNSISQQQQQQQEQQR